MLLFIFLSFFWVTPARNGPGFQKCRYTNSHLLDIRKVHSFPVHMKRKAPQTEAVGPSYPPNTSKNLSLTLGPGQKITLNRVLT